MASERFLRDFNVTKKGADIGKSDVTINETCVNFCNFAVGNQ